MQHQLSRLSASLPWLDKPAQVLHDVTAPIFGPEAPDSLKDALYGTWLGHPLHPALTDVPIGSWTVSAALDLLGQERAADATLKLGVLGAFGAAATGVAQWWDLQEMEEPKRLGVLHATLNTTALGFYLASWALRDNGNRKAGVATALTGYAIASSSAWIGGHLSFRLGIGVSRDAFDEPADEWIDVGTINDFPDGQLSRVDANGIPVVVYRDGEYFYAAAATCTHVGGPLDEGERDGTCVTCPWHGSTFDLRDGTVVHGPATSPVHVYETQNESGAVQIRPLPN